MGESWSELLAEPADLILDVYEYSVKRDQLDLMDRK